MSNNVNDNAKMKWKAKGIVERGSITSVAGDMEKRRVFS